MSSDRTKLLNSMPRRSSCSFCGAPNKCAMEEGKSYSACWCMSLPKVEAIESNSCLCKSCLTNVISPCIKECKLDEDKLRCVSCKRTAEQIKHWSSFTLEQKLDIINQNTGNS